MCKGKKTLIAQIWGGPAEPWQVISIKRGLKRILNMSTPTKIFCKPCAIQFDSRSKDALNEPRPRTLSLAQHMRQLVPSGAQWQPQHALHDPVAMPSVPCCVHCPPWQPAGLSAVSDPCTLMCTLELAEF